MATSPSFTTFVALVDVSEPNVQNVQEMASTWGTIRREFEDVDASVKESYAILGEFDFLVVFEAPDAESAFKTDVILERHGLDVQTMEALETDAFAELVDDV